jgi:hypothetical protein
MMVYTVTLALGWQTQEDFELKASLSYIVRLFLTKKEEQNKTYLFMPIRMHFLLFYF